MLFLIALMTFPLGAGIFTFALIRNYKRFITSGIGLLIVGIVAFLAHLSSNQLAQVIKVQVIETVLVIMTFISLFIAPLTFMQDVRDDPRT